MENERYRSVKDTLSYSPTRSDMPTTTPQPASHVTPRRRELQLAPGVYFTPGPTSTPATSAQRPVEELSVAELRSEHDALVKSVEMLQLSNEQMRSFDPNDSELVQAVGENLAIILKRRARAALLDRRIQVLLAGNSCDAARSHTHGTHAPAIDDATGGANGAGCGPVQPAQEGRPREDTAGEAPLEDPGMYL